MVLSPTARTVAIAFACLIFCHQQTHAFTTSITPSSRLWGLSRSSYSPSLLRSSEEAVEGDDDDAELPDAESPGVDPQEDNATAAFIEAVTAASEDVMEQVERFSDKDREERQELKRTLLQLGASYDRGFGASPKARQEAIVAIEQLELLNTEEWAARGISGNETSPLEGSWRMIWTNAQDVLVLGASPVATVGAIYQVFCPPVVTNIIDFIPRAQALIPPSMGNINSLFRAEVTTRASVRPNRPNRVGLVFEKVNLKPVKVLGVEVSDNFPALGFDLPRINIPATDPETGLGFFDVSYLDDEMLIIRQNAPGGLFVLIKCPNNDP